MKKGILMIAVLAMMAMGMNAQGPAKVPAIRTMIERVQPNGDTLRTYLRGDEHKHWMMTEDGWQILDGKKGWYVYAKTNCKGEVVASCRKARNAEQRSKCENKWLDKNGVKKNL